MERPVGSFGSNVWGASNNVHDYMVVLTLLRLLAQTGMTMSERIGTEDESRPPMYWNIFNYILENTLMHSLDCGRAAATNADEFNVGRNVHESKSTLDIYACGGIQRSGS